MTERDTAIETLLSKRPSTLTLDRIERCLPRYELNPDWAAKRDAGLLPDGPARLLGMLRQVWPEERLSAEEAEWVLAVREHASWRALARYIVGDDNQITGMDLENAARRLGIGTY